ncbi:MAG: 6,7-dimethyl-8-ribityllumazine synthase [Alphaproteobacteria bacterium]|nr:6,7-dimethyl-8-ribityllumazine synthase [Alphaproteobacteria bacterium]
MTKTVAIVTGDFHAPEAERMIAAASATAKARGLAVGPVVRVPGSMEVPLALKRLLSRNDIDAAVALGVIERGETKHGLVMAQTVVGAIIGLQLEFMKPVGVGIIGPEVFPSQIAPRVEPYAEAAMVAVARMLE